MGGQWQLRGRPPGPDCAGRSGGVPAAGAVCCSAPPPTRRRIRSARTKPRWCQQHAHVRQCRRAPGYTRTSNQTRACTPPASNSSAHVQRTRMTSACSYIAVGTTVAPAYHMPLSEHGAPGSSWQRNGGAEPLATAGTASGTAAAAGTDTAGTGTSTANAVAASSTAAAAVTCCHRHWQYCRARGQRCSTGTGSASGSASDTATALQLAAGMPEQSFPRDSTSLGTRDCQRIHHRWSLPVSPPEP